MVYEDEFGSFSLNNSVDLLSVRRSSYNNIHITYRCDESIYHNRHERRKALAKSRRKCIMIVQE